MRKKCILAVMTLPLLGNMAVAEDINNNAAYAVLQNCMAGAEQEHNENTGLDQYCVDSYLATLDSE